MQQPAKFVYADYYAICRCRAYFVSADKISFHAWSSWSVDRALCSHCQRELTGASSEVDDVAQSRDICVCGRTYDTGQGSPRADLCRPPTLQNFYRPWHLAARSGAHHPDSYNAVWGYAVVQLVEALHYKLEGRGFDSR